MGLDRAAIAMVCSLEFWRMAVMWTLALLFSYLQLLSARRPRRSYPRRRFSPNPDSTVKLPICVVTGAASGLGAAAARALAREGFHVVLAGRCYQSLVKTIEEIKQQDGDACLDAFQVDLSSFLSIKKFEESIKQWLLDSELHPSIQLLINNAGILATSSRVTADGCDQMMETNYIGAFTLTNLLLPLLKNSPTPSRIVNVTSFTHRCIFKVEVDEEALGVKNLRCVSTSKKYLFAQTYEYSKLYLLLFSYELHRKLYAMDSSCNVSVVSADPGVVETNIMRELPSSLSQLAFMGLRVMRFLQSPDDGVDSIIDAALAPPEASGQYFFGGKGRTINSSQLSYNVGLAKRLWSSSLMLSEEALRTSHESAEA